MNDHKDDLLIQLWELSNRIRSHGGVLPGDSMIERYKYFVENTEYGRACVYARKSKDLFLTHDHEDIKKLIFHIVEMYEKMGI